MAKDEDKDKDKEKETYKPKVGDKVVINTTKTVGGQTLGDWVKKETFVVSYVSGTSVTLTYNGKQIGTVNASHVSKPTKPKSSNKNKDKEKSADSKKADGKSKKNKDKNKNKKKEVKDVDKLSKGIENGLVALVKSGNKSDKELLRYNMRLFGLPHQFTKYCDYRTYSVSDKSANELIGRKYIENIMTEAPVLTVIPGKPKYLKGARNKKGTTFALMSSASESISAVTANKLIADDNKHLWKKLRYYDFEQDYLEYIKYVNILCSTEAAFLELQGVSFGGGTLGTYDWINYRWNADKYESAVGNSFGYAANRVKGFIEGLKAGGRMVWNAAKSIFTGQSKSDRKKVSNQNQEVVDKLSVPDEDPDVLTTLEEVLASTNFVQFYVDASGGVSESAENTTGESMLASQLIGNLQQYSKEFGFILNSGGIDASGLIDSASKGMDVMGEKLSINKKAGLISRIMGVGESVIKGENMIFPEIYQGSRYSKSYNITVDLRAPYGNRLSYFLDVVVPLMHLLALVLPKQTTANTYGSPFLIKAFIPGQFTCNLGIVSSMSIERNSTGDSWTVDGYPNAIKVSLSISDLYSDLTMTPNGISSVLLFLSNTSLIEFLATNCGVNLVTPQLKNKIAYATNYIKTAFKDTEKTVQQTILGGAESFIMGLVGI